MSLKSDFTAILQVCSNSYLSQREKIVKAMNNKDFSVTGKRHAVNNMIDAHNDIINRNRANIIEAVSRKVNALDTEEKEDLQNRYRDVNYRMALANTLDVLGLCAGNVVPEDMAALLSMFENDPMAITSIKKTIGEYSKNAGQNMFSYAGIVPADNRGKRQERLKKVERTILNELDSLTLSIPTHGLDEETAKDTFDAHEIPTQPIMSEISSTIGYMSQCNDDLTVYTPEPAQPGIDLKSAYNGMFNS